MTPREIEQHAAMLELIERTRAQLAREDEADWLLMRTLAGGYDGEMLGELLDGE